MIELGSSAVGKHSAMRALSIPARLGRLLGKHDPMVIIQTDQE